MNSQELRKYNEERLHTVFVQANAHPENIQTTSLRTSTGKDFRIEVVTSPYQRSDIESITDDLNELALASPDYMISSPDMISFSQQITDSQRQHADITEHVKLRSGTEFDRKVCSEKVITDMLLTRMDSFQYVINEDMRMKREVVDSIYSHQGLFTKSFDELTDDENMMREMLNDNHRMVYGSGIHHQKRFEQASLTDAIQKMYSGKSITQEGLATYRLDIPLEVNGSCFIGQPVVMAGGDGIGSALFYPGNDMEHGETSLLAAMNYCELMNMHMLYGTERDGFNGDTYVCFTEPKALSHGYMVDFAIREMAMGHDMMADREFIGVTDTGYSYVSPMDNVSNEQRIAKALKEAYRYQREDTPFELVSPEGKPLDCIANYDAIEGYGIKATRHDFIPLDKPIILAGENPDKLRESLTEVTTSSIRFAKALREGYSYNYEDSATTEPVVETVDESVVETRKDVTMNPTKADIKEKADKAREIYGADFFKSKTCLIAEKAAAEATDEEAKKAALRDAKSAKQLSDAQIAALYDGLQAKDATGKSLTLSKDDAHFRFKYDGIASIDGVETPVSLNAVYGENSPTPHMYSAEELEALYAGREITIENHVAANAKTNTPMDITGKLASKTLFNKPYVGFDMTSSCEHSLTVPANEPKAFDKSAQPDAVAAMDVQAGNEEELEEVQPFS